MDNYIIAGLGILSTIVGGIIKWAYATSHRITRLEGNSEKQSEIQDIFKDWLNRVEGKLDAIILKDK